MNFVFQQQFDRELLHSERRRAIILIVIFSAAVAFRWVNMFLFTHDAQTLEIESFSTVWLFPLAIILFEVFSLAYINARIRTKGKRIPLIMQYLNTAFEICLPSLIILHVAGQHLFYNVLQSPIILIYFLFIILSTLRLNFGLSFFCGLLASISYTVFSVFLYGHFNTNDAGWSFLLLLSGVASGLVARQIRSGINNSLYETQRRHKVENLFGQQISMEIAEKMLENNGIMESKRMEVTVMFIDIRNFTHFAAGKSPEEIVHYQNAFFRIVINTVTKHDGIVNQILGDGCMVTFGAPLPVQYHSQKAVNAALEILDQLEKAVQKGYIHPTRIGIGIHTGEVVTGNIGTDARQQYSITGSVVIMASRIEQLNKEFQSQLLISEEVTRSIANFIPETNSYRNIPLKGFEKPMTIYKVA
ncbi:MAG TPA: adenylate/guanylate cyclase domain-containing protein [Chitinophagaceae bacterium]|nr:adenylate/guanylate cyclase domain-containing protein [Chitinophagaceae bacterium]